MRLAQRRRDDQLGATDSPLPIEMGGGPLRTLLDTRDPSETGRGCRSWTFCRRRAHYDGHQVSRSRGFAGVLDKVRFVKPCVAMRVVFVHRACVKDGSWWWHRTAELLAEQDVASESPALPSWGETGEPTGAHGPGLSEDVGGGPGSTDGERSTDGRGRPQLRWHRRGGSSDRRRRRAPSAARVQLPARSRAEPLLVRRRGTRPVPRHRSRGRHVHRPPGRPGRDVLAGLRSGDPATSHRQDGPAEPGGPRAAGSVSRLEAGGFDVPRLRPRTGAPPPNGNASSLGGRAASWSSTPGHHPFLSQPAAVSDLVLSL
jgi:hypothetical protein